MKRHGSGSDVGVDFCEFNLDKDLPTRPDLRRNMVEANLKAFEIIKGAMPRFLEKEFDIVLTHGGYVGRIIIKQPKEGVGPSRRKRRSYRHHCANNRMPSHLLGQLNIKS